jgi:hypothetical protein
MATIELQAPSGYTLTATIWPHGGTPAIATGIVLTEQARVGRYRGTAALTAGSWYDVQVFDSATLVADWQVLIQSGGISYCEDRPYALWSRLGEQVATGGPVVVIPAPSDDTQTAVWTVCYDANGLPEPGVEIVIRAVGVVQGAAAAFDTAPVITTSGADGVATALIPRSTALRFTATRNGGQSYRFAGVDSAILELPHLLGP